MRVLAISGSLRRDSYNTKLLRAAEELLPAGVELEYFDELESVPPYNEDRDNDEAPLAAAYLRDRIADADALLIATPEYNFSFPGVLKNAIDWLSRPPLDAVLARKPVAIVGAGGRLGSARAQYHLRQVCACLSMLPLPRPEVFIPAAWEKFDAQGSPYETPRTDSTPPQGSASGSPSCAASPKPTTAPPPPTATAPAPPPPSASGYH